MFVTDYTKHLLDNVKKIHFIGCGGSGMYPLIQILNAKGYVISGSDVLDGSIIQYEREMGVKVSLGHSADNVIGTDLVVYSAAISKDNVELNAAASYGPRKSTPPAADAADGVRFAVTEFPSCSSSSILVKTSAIF